MHPLDCPGACATYVSVLAIALGGCVLIFGGWVAIHAADAAWRRLRSFWARLTAAEDVRREL
jgi:hypothetical protein